MVELIPFFALLIPITALMIPIVAIITAHMRQMAQIRYSQPLNNPDEVAALRKEVQELKEMVHTQILALDSYSKRSAAPPSEDDLRNRMSVNG